MAKQRSFFDELKQRHVVRAAIIYAAAVWALAQGISQLSPAFGLATGVTFWFVIACVIGFPFWIAFAWFFKFTTHGIERESEELDDSAAVHRAGRILDYWIIGIMAVAIVLLLTNELVLQRGKTLREFAATPSTRSITAQTIPAKSIAVLPFENLSGDKDNAYFVAGMQDLILTKLADIGDLKVIARTSTAMYASHPENLTQIGQQLGVATILEGSVQKQGNEVLINVQLIDTRTDAHIWAQAYTRTLDNVFGVEGEVAGQIADALNAKLSPAQSAQLAAVPTTNQAAYDAFLRAEYQANQGDVNQDIIDWKAAIPLYRQAIAQDSGFALAYARLSIVESQLARFSGGAEGVKQLFEQARTDAEQALKLAPSLPASQLALGYSDYYGKGDFTAALKAFDAALALRPNDADALEARGLVERRLGHFEAALASLTRAAARNPRSTVFANFTGLACLELGRYTEAEAWSQRALALDPSNNDARDINSWAILFSTGDVVRALAALQGDAPQLKRNRVSFLVYQRKYPEAIALLESIPDTPEYFSPHHPSKVLRLAELYRLAGDAAKARPSYAQALHQVRAERARTQGVGLMFVWYSTAQAELGLGHTAEGLSAIFKARALGAKSGDQAFGPWWLETSAQLYAEADRPDLAVPLLAKALVTPGIGAYYSPVLLWLDPAWDPIRHDQAFQALLKKYAKHEPAITYDAPAAASTSSATAQ